MADPKLERLKVAHGGLNSDASADYVGPDQAPVHQNLLSRPGRLVPRGGLTDGFTLAGSQDAISGVMPSSDEQLVTYSARDRFEQSAGALAGKTMTTGGTWTGAGDASDFTINTTDDIAERAVNGDADDVSGRYAIAGTTVFTDVVVQVSLDLAAITGGLSQGVFARYTDVNNWVMARRNDQGLLEVIKRVAGTTSDVQTNVAIADPVPGTPNVISLALTSAGGWTCTYAGQIVASGQDAVFATGGALEDGRVGMYDISTSSTTIRKYDDFGAWVPTEGDGLVGYWADTFDPVLPFKTKTAARTLSGTAVTLTTARAAPTTRAVQLAGATYAFGGQTTTVERYLLRYAPDTSEPQLYLSGSTPTAPYLTGRYGDVIVHLERLWVLGATLGSSGGPETIMYSDPGDAGVVTDTTRENWEDDVSGLTNVIDLPGDDLPVAFGRVGQHLAIYSERSIWTLYGASNDTFNLRRTADNIRVFDPQSVCPVDSGTYALADQGLIYHDGGSIHQVSGNVQAELVAAVAQARADWESAVTGFGRVAYLPGGCLLVSIGKQEHSSSEVPTIYFAGIFDIARSSWTRFSTSITTGEAPTHIVEVNGVPLGLDGRCGYSLASVGIPESQTHIADDNPLSANDLRIPLKWHTRLARLASPSLSASVRRVLVDYKFVSGLDSGWYVELVDGLGNVVRAEEQVPAQDDPPTQLYRRRQVYDVSGEASDLQVQIEWRGTWTPSDDITAAELHDVVVEYAPASQRGSG